MLRPTPLRKASDSILAQSDFYVLKENEHLCPEATFYFFPAAFAGKVTGNILPRRPPEAW